MANLSTYVLCLTLVCTWSASAAQKNKNDKRGIIAGLNAANIGYGGGYSLGNVQSLPAGVTLTTEGAQASGVNLPAGIVLGSAQVGNSLPSGLLIPANINLSNLQTTATTSSATALTTGATTSSAASLPSGINTSGVTLSNGINLASLLNLNLASGVGKVTAQQPQAIAIPVDRIVPVSVQQPVAVPVDRPVPVTVNRPVAVPVDRPVAVPVDRPVAVNVPQPVSVPVSQPVAVPVPSPVPVNVINKVLVPVPQPYTVYRAVPVSVGAPQLAVGGLNGVSFGNGLSLGSNLYNSGLYSLGRNTNSLNYGSYSLGAPPFLGGKTLFGR